MVVINTVINTLVDALKAQPDSAYRLAPSHPVNLLQYADDTCIIANSPAAAQNLVDMTDGWLQWSAKKVKVPKYHSLATEESSSGALSDPHLTISNQTIPFTGGNPIKFLGMKVQVPSDKTAAGSEVKTKLESMLSAVDKAPLTRHQKLKLYKQAICPRLTWLLMIED